ncbi:hypothetical protein CN245_05290 [Sinorhizobium meliloti]|nr:hypothetical protein CN245_05290 [Sinorhizobium meliloti]
MRAFIEYIIETLKGSSQMTAFGDDTAGVGAALCDFEPGTAKPQKGSRLTPAVSISLSTICLNSDLDENVTSESMGFGRYALLPAPTGPDLHQARSKNLQPFGRSSSSS